MGVSRFAKARSAPARRTATGAHSHPNPSSSPAERWSRAASFTAPCMRTSPTAASVARATVRTGAGGGGSGRTSAVRGAVVAAGGGEGAAAGLEVPGDPGAAGAAWGAGAGRAVPPRPVAQAAARHAAASQEKRQGPARRLPEIPVPADPALKMIGYVVISAGAETAKT